MYKIPQNVEADDKFLGPLSFKQFIYCGIAGIAAYISFLSLTNHAAYLLVVFLPVLVVFGFLGFPWGRDQPTEIWLAARIRFFIKPRKRIWNQSGVKELVTITVPKKVEKHYTDGLSQNEVKSRLNSLAMLLDSRGWAVKNVASNVYSNPLTQSADDDRLLAMSAMPQPVSDTSAATDVLDEASNTTALHFNDMIQASEQRHRQQAMDILAAARQDPATQQQPQMQAQQAQADAWFANATPTMATGAAINAQQAPYPQQYAQPPMQQPYATFQQPAVVAPGMYAAPIQTTTPVAPAAQLDEAALLEKIHQQQEAEKQVAQYGHLKTILPMAEQQRLAQEAAVIAQQPVTPPVNPAIMSLANNDDLNVETIARQAKAAKDASDGEVVISLR